MTRGGSRGAKKETLASLGRRTHRALSTLDPWLEEFSTSTDRSAALVGAAYLANALRDCIARIMRPDLDETLEAALFSEARAPLSDFNSRIELAYAFKLISEQDRNDLHRVRRIRNLFAHSALQFDFQNATIAKECGALNISGVPNAINGGPRQRYYARVIELALHIEKRGAEIMLPGTFPGYEWTLWPLKPTVPPKPSPAKRRATSPRARKSPR